MVNAAGTAAGQIFHYFVLLGIDVTIKEQNIRLRHFLQVLHPTPSLCTTQAGGAGGGTEEPVH